MFFFSIRQTAILAILSVILAGGGSLSLAGDFRIESRVYLEDEKEPKQTSTTLFKGGIVYNYVDDDPEVTVLDRAAERFVVLHVEVKVRSEVTAEQLAGYTGELRGHLARNRQPTLQFLSRPVFNESFNATTNTLRLDSHLLTYDVEGEPCQNADCLAAYREFSDWQSQFNIRMTPTAIPFPLARLPLSEALERRKILPRKVRRKTEAVGKLADPSMMRSEHEVLPRLLDADFAKIDETDRQLVEFESVDLETYRARTAKK